MNEMKPNKLRLNYRLDGAIEPSDNFPQWKEAIKLKLTENLPPNPLSRCSIFITITSNLPLSEECNTISDAVLGLLKEAKVVRSENLKINRLQVRQLYSYTKPPSTVIKINEK